MPKNYVAPKEIVTSKNLSSNIRVLKSCFVNEIKDLCIFSTQKLLSLLRDLSDYVVKFDNLSLIQPSSK